MVYLGVDAGNSKTVALVCRDTGEIVGAGRSDCGDIYGVADAEEAVHAVLSAVDVALATAGLDRQRVGRAAFRLAGVDWPEDAEFWDGVLRARWPSLRCRSISNDGYAAIRCGEPSGVGVSVVAGTAAAVAARGSDGATWDMGWWCQHALGAAGLVSDAMHASLLAELGVAPETALAPALAAYFGQPDIGAVNHYFTRRTGRPSHPERARAARVVIATASGGDPVAVRIVTEQGQRLALYAEIAARKVGLTGDVGVVLSGSVLMAEPSPVRAALIEELARLLPGARANPATLPPVAGAALDALGEGGVPITDDVVRRLTGSAPDPEFLRT